MRVSPKSKFIPHLVHLLGKSINNALYTLDTVQCVSARTKRFNQLCEEYVAMHMEWSLMRGKCASAACATIYIFPQFHSANLVQQAECILCWVVRGKVIPKCMFLDWALPGKENDMIVNECEYLCVYLRVWLCARFLGGS